MNSKSEICRKRLPVGISDFKEMMEGNYYFVDNTLWLEDVMEASAKVMLVPRPRRFGKTLNLSMLRYFLEKTDPDHRPLFDGLKIYEHECFDRYQGKFPVIWMTFKDVKFPDWQNCMNGLKYQIREEYHRHRYLLDSDILYPEQKAYYRNILTDEKLSFFEYDRALKYLSDHLFNFHRQRSVILIDEYDTPIYAGYQYGYYELVVSFIRNFLSGGLKDNPLIEKGVMTGIMRIAKESIFSGLNNPGVYTLMDKRFTEYFGFTEADVRKMLDDFGMSDRYEEVSHWYNGYLFGDTVIYNPWSVLNYMDNQGEAKPYWSNTADIAMIERLATRGGREIRDEIGKLLEGKTIEQSVYETIVMRDLDQRDDLIWSFLLFSGYLKPVRHIEDEEWELTVPNNEVRLMYRNLIKTWFSTRVEQNHLQDLITALQTANIQLFENMLRLIVNQILSFHDLSGQPEKVYHALVLGMLVWMSGRYDIRSNRESGMGRFDIMLKPKNTDGRGIIIEFKKVFSESEKAYEQVLKDALQQIEKKAYVTELAAAGIRDVLRIAVAFRGKELWVSHSANAGL